MKELPTSPPESDFPSDVLKWAKKNAAPKMALKLMQICKYFQFPYFVINTLEGNYGGWRYRQEDSYSYRNIDIKNLSKKLWVTRKLGFWNNNVLIPLLPKIAVSDFYFLSLKNQNITFNEFKFLTAAGNVTEVFLYDSLIKDESDHNVPLEDILECLPKIEKLRMYAHNL
uniref:Uncharacterized protein n=1 Tax=Panagrolaimus sp. ES5 TaxID=591445 RepID=A0AC34FCT7_9BILA